MTFWVEGGTVPYMIKDRVVAFFVSRNHVGYASSCGSNPVLELAARHLGKVRIKESLFMGKELWPRNWIACRSRN